MSDEELLQHAEAMITSVDRLINADDRTQKLQAHLQASMAASLLVIARNSVPITAEQLAIDMAERKYNDEHQV